MRGQAGDELVRQGPVHRAVPGGRRRRVGLRHERRPRVLGARHRRGFRRLRLRDHVAHRPFHRSRHRRAGDVVLRAHRPPPGRRRLRRVVAADADVAGRAGQRPLRRRPHHRRARWPRHLRRGAVRPRRRRVVLRGQPPSPRHRLGHHGHTALFRVRAPRPRDPGTAHRRHADVAGGVGGRLRRTRCGRPVLLRACRRAGRPRNRRAHLRQARSTRTPPHGRCRVHRRDRRRRPRKRIRRRLCIESLC